MFSLLCIIFKVIIYVLCLLFSQTKEILYTKENTHIALYHIKCVAPEILY